MTSYAGPSGRRSLFYLELPAGLQAQPAADRVLPRPQHLRGRFAQNDGILSRAALRLESPPEQQRNSQGLKVVRLNVHVEEDGSRIFGRRLFSIDRNCSGSNAAAIGRACAGNRNHARQGRQPCAQLTDQRSPAVGAVFLSFRESNLEVQYVFGIVAGVHLHRPNRASNQHASRDQQHQRDRNLGHRQQIAHPAIAYLSRSRTRLRRGRKRGSRAFQCGRQTKQDSGRHADAKHVGKNSRVRRHVKDKRAVFLRKRIRNHHHQGLEERPAEQQRNRSGNQAQQCAFRQQLPDDPQSAGPKRQPHAQFILSRRSPRQLQAGYIRASNHQHHSHRDHNQQNRVFQPAVLLQRVRKRRARPNHRLCGFTQIRVRIVQGTELARNQGHLRLRLVDAHSGSEPRIEPAAQVFPIAQPIVVRINQRLETERKPEIRRLHTRAHKVVRCNSDDGDGNAVQPNGLAQHRRISSKPLLPVVLADQPRRREPSLKNLQAQTSGPALPQPREPRSSFPRPGTYWPFPRYGRSEAAPAALPASHSRHYAGPQSLPLP